MDNSKKICIFQSFFFFSCLYFCGLKNTNVKFRLFLTVSSKELDENTFYFAKKIYFALPNVI